MALSDLLASIPGAGSADPLAMMSALQQQGQPQQATGAPTGAAPIDPTGASSLPAAAPGNVLARLRSAAGNQQQLPRPPAQQNPWVYSGAPDVRGMSKSAALFAGLQSGLKDLSQSQLLRQQQETQNFQNNLALYKMLFDMQHQGTEEGFQREQLAEAKRKDLAAEDPVLQGKLAAAQQPEDSSSWQKIGERIDPDTGQKIDVMGYPPAAPASSDDDTEKTTAGAPAKKQMSAEEYLKSLGVDNTSPPKTRGMLQQELGNETVAGDNSPSFQLPDEQKARLNNLDPNVANHVEAILQGRETMPKLGTGNRASAAFVRAVNNGVLQVNPQFDVVRNQAQVDTRKKYMPSGANNAPGTLIQNGDAAIDHLSTLLDASRAMPNYGSTMGNVVSGAANVTGGAIGNDYAKAQGDLDTKAQIAATEAIKYLAGTSSGGGERERERLMTNFSSQVPPDKRESSIKALAQDILEKKIELQSGWRRGMGPEIPDFEVISPNSIENVRKLGLDGYLPKLGGSAAKNAAAASAATPVATPQGTPAAAPSEPAFQTIEDSAVGRAMFDKLPKGTTVFVPGKGYTTK